MVLIHGLLRLQVLHKNLTIARGKESKTPRTAGFWIIGATEGPEHWFHSRGLLPWDLAGKLIAPPFFRFGIVLEWKKTPSLSWQNCFVTPPTTREQRFSRCYRYKNCHISRCAIGSSIFWWLELFHIPVGRRPSKTHAHRIHVWYICNIGGII